MKWFLTIYTILNRLIPCNSWSERQIGVSAETHRQILCWQSLNWRSLLWPFPWNSRNPMEEDKEILEVPKKKKDIRRTWFTAPTKQGSHGLMEIETESSEHAWPTFDSLHVCYGSCLVFFLRLLTVGVGVYFWLFCPLLRLFLFALSSPWYHVFLCLFVVCWRPTLF